MECLLTLLLASMMVSVNSCEFGNDAIQVLYDRAGIFRTTKAFDPTNPEIPLKAYSNYVTLGLRMKINDEDLEELYENNAANEIETKHGVYKVNDSVTLRYEPNENGELIFKDSNFNLLGFTLQSFDDELPANVEETYKKALLDLKIFRQKMFAFQKGLSKDDLERVRSYSFTPSPSGIQAGFLVQYTETIGGEIVIYSTKKDGKETIHGTRPCLEDYKYQEYNVVDGKVAVLGEPKSYGV